MKKLFLLLTVLVMAILFVGCGEGYGCEGCGNNNIGIGTYTFNYIHIFNDDGEDKCFEILSWKDDDVGIEVKLKDGNTLFVSEGRYLLSKNACPLCN